MLASSIEEVLMDHDEKGALEFLKRVIKAKTDRHTKSSRGPEFERPSTGLR